MRERSCSAALCPNRGADLMQLLTLDLERYGPFTGRTVTFSPDAKLHVVYGSNEAGKSCALAAITDLFFGIERLTRYDFLHDGREMRIGATITARDGSRLAFRRRKGNKSTLIDAADGALGDDALLPFLGSLSREVFCSAFGLNAEALRSGAEEMLKSEGDVGATLFAAASGMRGVAELRRSLEDEAGRLFAPRASKDRYFYQALERFEEARKAISERELRAGDWKALNEKISELADRLDEIKALRGGKAAARARLSRIKRVAPLVRLIDGDLTKLVELGALPEVPTGFTERLREGLDVLHKAHETSKRIAGDEAKAVKDHADIAVDEALVVRAGDVLRLFGETGAYADSQGDLPRIQADTDEYRGALAELAVRLGRADASAVEAAQPSDAAQALVRGLVVEGRVLTDELSRNTAALVTERDSLAKLEHQRAERGGLTNPRPLNEKFAALSPVLKTLEKRTETERAIRTEARSLREAAGRLEPTVANLDALAASALPSVGTITRFRKNIEMLVQDIQREHDRHAASTEALAATEANLREVASGRPVSSVESIAAKRQQRDTEWSRLRATLFGSTEALAGVALAEGVASFERHSSEADRLADSAASDAERVAAHAVESRRLAEERGKKTEAKNRLTALEASRQEMLEAWTAAWAPAGIVPLPPAEMAAWLSAVEGLLDRREKLESLCEELATIETAVRSIEPMLGELAVEAGLLELNELDAALVAARIEDRLRSISDSWDKARDLETSVRDTRSRIDKLVAAGADTARLLEDWSTRWRLALPAIGLLATATPDEADAALDAWKEVPGTIRERDNRARRVAGMQRNIEDFEGRAKNLLEGIAPDLTTLPADAAVKALNERVATARAAESWKAESARRLTETVRAREEADIAFAEADAALATLAAKLPPDSDLADLLARLTQHDDLLDALNERRTQLIAQAEGHDEDRLRADLATFNSDEAEATLKALTEEDEALDSEAQEVFAAHDRAVRERAALERGVGAEIAAQQRRNAEAELIAVSREWMVLKLGALLISTAIDRRRASQQDPLMARAGALFAMLTGGSFAGVGQDYDDQDMPRLVGRRPTGGMVPVAGMSTGARDQLYFALRLAYLEEYAGRTEPAPFIGDDLFATFDEDRTANGLAALAAIGDRVQPILFTHHRHVADIARTRIAADVTVLEPG